MFPEKSRRNTSKRVNLIRKNNAAIGFPPRMCGPGILPLAENSVVFHRGEEVRCRYFRRLFACAMKKCVDIRKPMQNGFRAVFSNPIFALFGAAIAVPKGILQLWVLGSMEIGSGLALSQGAEPSVPLWIIGAVFFFVGFVLVAGASGIVALVFLMNRHENNEKLSFSVIRNPVRQRIKPVVLLEVFLVALALFVGTLLSVPADLAASRGLDGLSRGLSFSALGLLLSISLVFFFLRQYAALYLSLSNISVRSALENASRLFRLHIRETLLLSGALFLAEIGILFGLSGMFLFFERVFGVAFPSIPSWYGIGIEWTGMLGALSLIEAWKWLSWTSFFRMIALPKDPEPVLQKTETVLQQESAVRLDEA